MYSSFVQTFTILIRDEKMHPCTELFLVKLKEKDHFTFWLRSLAGTGALFAWLGKVDEDTDGRVGEDGGEAKNKSRGDMIVGVLRCFPIIDTPIAGYRGQSMSVEIRIKDQ